MPRHNVITQSTQKVCFYPVVNINHRGVCGSARVEGHSSHYTDVGPVPGPASLCPSVLEMNPGLFLVLRRITQPLAPVYECGCVT